jgi:acetolactate synthase-1/2/3 large subunit
MSTQIKVSDIITNFFEEKGFKNVFLLSGGMMIHLLDSISKSDRIKYVCNHHEQACAIAAEGYARVSNSAGLCYATSGPGATNTITGIAGAWLDSSPVVYITGQSRTTLTVRGAGPKDLRMLGNFEVDIIEIAKPITKYVVFVDKADEILYHLEKAYYLATEGRPGPVLLDIPLDIQGAKVSKELLKKFDIPTKPKYNVESDFEQLKSDLLISKAPLIIAGHGIRVANKVNEFRELVKKLNIAVVTTQLANDLLPYDNELYIGKVGLRGDRAGNFAVQHADLIITIGTSLHITTTGYELEDFAPQAKKIVIDIDSASLQKNSSISDKQILCDVQTCIAELNRFDLSLLNNDWINKLRSWKSTFLIINEPHERFDDEINTYHLIDLLSNELNGDEIIVTDAGSLYYITGQAFKVKKDQRIIISGALGAMGYALPAAIGASFAEPEKNIICITGDGSMQLNIQELQTLSNYNLNCKVIVINNKGYASIRNSQAAFQSGHIAASSEETGVTFPSWQKIADAYSVRYLREDKYSNVANMISNMLSIKGPVLMEIIVPEKVTMIPAVTSVLLPTGMFKSNRLHEMTPELSVEVLQKAGIQLKD